MGCDVPEILNGSFVSYALKIDFGSRLEVHCNEGFTLYKVGRPTAEAICLDSGKLSVGIKDIIFCRKCIANNCYKHLPMYRYNKLTLSLKRGHFIVKFNFCRD